MAKLRYKCPNCKAVLLSRQPAYNIFDRKGIACNCRELLTIELKKEEAARLVRWLAYLAVSSAVHAIIAVGWLI